MDFLPWTTFSRLVTRYGGNHRVRTLPCSDHFRILAFAQLTYRESLRDIEACLAAQAPNLYHLGIRAPVKRATLAEANERRDWRISAAFAQRLIAQARPLYADEELGLDLANTMYALDSTTVALCRSVFPWASFRATKAAIKLHTLLDLRGPLPRFLHVSAGRWHDVNMLDLLPPEPAAIYVMARGYLDFARLRARHQAGAFFVTRAKANTALRRLSSAPNDRPQGILCDQTVVLSGPSTHKKSPLHLRRVRFKDRASQQTRIFLTNLFGPAPTTICALYTARWQIELFFKWVKQHLRITQFYGTSENAVKAQIWVAVSVYVLVALLKKRLHLDLSLYTLLQILSVTLFEKTPLTKGFFDKRYRSDEGGLSNQLNLFHN